MGQHRRCEKCKRKTKCQPKKCKKCCKIRCKKFSLSLQTKNALGQIISGPFNIVDGSLLTYRSKRPILATQIPGTTNLDVSYASGYDVHRTIYVDNFHGTDTPSGFSEDRENPGNPFASLEAANAAANQGNVVQIVVRPGSGTQNPYGPIQGLSNLNAAVYWVFEPGTFAVNIQFTAGVLGVFGSGLALSSSSPIVTNLSGTGSGFINKNKIFKFSQISVGLSFGMNLIGIFEGTSISNDSGILSYLPVNYEIDNIFINNNLADLFSGSNMNVRVGTIQYTNIHSICIGSNLVFNCELITCTNQASTPPALFIDAFGSGSQGLTINVGTIQSNSGTILNTSFFPGGNFNTIFNASSIIDTYNGNDKPLFIFNGGGTSYVTCTNVSSNSTININGGVVQIADSHITTTANNNINVNGGDLRLKNVTLTNTGPGFTVNSANPQNYRVYGSVLTNNGVNPLITNLIPGTNGLVVTDPNVV